MSSNGFARNILGPAELQLAGDVFAAALADVGESELHPYVIRQNLSRHVMQSIFAGERDAARLRNGALASLRKLEVMEGAEGRRLPQSSSNENIRALYFAKA